MIRGGRPKKENVANRHAQERVEYILKVVADYGAEGVEEKYITAHLQYNNGVDPRKSKQILSSLLWMDKVRKNGSRYYTTNIETEKLSEQTTIQGQPTSPGLITKDEEGASVLELINRVRTHTFSGGVTLLGHTSPCYKSGHTFKKHVGTVVYAGNLPTSHKQCYDIRGRLAEFVKQPVPRSARSRRLNPSHSLVPSNPLRFFIDRFWVPSLKTRPFNDSNKAEGSEPSLWTFGFKIYNEGRVASKIDVELTVQSCFSPSDLKAESIDASFILLQEKNILPIKKSHDWGEEIRFDYVKGNDHFDLSYQRKIPIKNTGESRFSTVTRSFPIVPQDPHMPCLYYILVRLSGENLRDEDKALRRFALSFENDEPVFPDAVYMFGLGDLL